jgi:DNA-binding PadR family transcriptional regulator
MATGRPPRPRENRTRYVVLGMLSTGGPMTGYALRNAIAGSVGNFWQESYGQLYPALRSLSAEGLVSGKGAPGAPGREARIWSITPRGREELARWLALPPAMEPARNELLLKIYFAGAVAPEVTLANLARVEEMLRGMLGGYQQLDAHWERETAGHPDAPYWHLTLELGIAFARTALAWIDRARQVVRQQGRGRAASPSRSKGARTAARPGGTR